MFRDGRVLVSGLMLVLFGGMVALALSFSPRAQAAPLLIGVPGLILSAVQVLLELRSRALEAAAPAPRIGPPASVFLIWFAVFVAGVAAGGFHLAPPVLLFAFLRFQMKESWFASTAAAAGFAAVIYGVFELAMKLSLFEGLLWPSAKEWLKI